MCGGMTVKIGRLTYHFDFLPTFLLVLYLLTFLQDPQHHRTIVMTAPCAMASSPSNQRLDPARFTGDRIETVCPGLPISVTSCSKDRTLPAWLIPAERRGWRRLVQNFTPSWVCTSMEGFFILIVAKIQCQFAITMGTGIVAVLLHALSDLYPRHKGDLVTLSIVFFVLNVGLFLAILLISVLRYTLYPATWTLMLRHPVQSLFLGTIPMGFATIINMFVAVCVPAWGGSSSYIAWAMWWLDAVMSVTCCLWLPFQM